MAPDTSGPAFGSPRRPPPLGAWPSPAARISPGPAKCSPARSTPSRCAPAQCRQQVGSAHRRLAASPACAPGVPGTRAPRAANRPCWCGRWRTSPAADLGVRDLPEHAVLEAVAGFNQVRRGPSLRPDLRGAVVLAGRRHHRLPLHHVGRDRLLHIHVGSCPHSGDCRRAVPMVRRRDFHDVEFLLPEHFAVVAVVLALPPGAHQRHAPRLGGRPRSPRGKPAARAVPTK